MSTVFKGLTRPALIRGWAFRSTPFLECALSAFCLVSGFMRLCMPSSSLGWYAIKRVTKIDERF